MPIKSPFPGMDPWLESHWGDIHQRIALYACDQLQSHLPSDLRARLQERVFVESPDGPKRTIYPDVRVIQKTPSLAGGPAVAVLELTEDTVVVQISNEPVTEGYIEIVDVKSGQKVVTVIEVLTLANKCNGNGKESYQTKQIECRSADVNLVEIDLLRYGQRELIAPTARIPADFRSPYQVCVWRASKPFDALVYRVGLQKPLPSITIPLRPTDADVKLDLQALIEKAYQNGGYDDIDYRQEPDPPLEGSEHAWTQTLLEERGLR